MEVTTIYFLVILELLEFVRQKTHSNTDSNTETNVNAGPVRTATIRTVHQRTSETITRILQPYNVRVAHKLITTLRRLFTRTKTNRRTDREKGGKNGKYCYKLLYASQTNLKLSVQDFGL